LGWDSDTDSDGDERDQHDADGGHRTGAADHLHHVPVLKHSMNVRLPRATNEPQLIKPETVTLSVNLGGRLIFWTNQSFRDQAMHTRLQLQRHKTAARPAHPGRQGGTV
jgi:hypothetical protein